MTTPQATGSRLVTVSVLLAVVPAALAAQLFWGLQPHYGYDEAWHVYLADIRPTWKFLLAVAADPHPPLYYLLLRPFVSIGTDPLYPRLLSILPSLLSIPLLYALLRKLGIQRSIALLSVVLLAASTSFEQIAVTVRSYGLTVFLLLAGLWYWLDLFPDCRGRPSRFSSIAALALFSLAFGCLYAAAFATTTLFVGTALALLLSSTGSALRQNFLRYSGWPECLVFFLVHLLGASWFFFAWVRHINLQTPSHLSQFGLQPGQSASDFLYRGLHQELALFTPINLAGGAPTWLYDLALLGLLGLIGWLAVQAARQARPARLLLALSPLLLTATLALLGVLDKYPFGGGLRHQYILFPFLLMLLPLTIDAVSGQRRLGTFLMVVSIAIATLSAVQQYRSQPISEAPKQPWQAKEHALLFETGAPDPILVPAYGLIPAYLNRIEHGIAYDSSYQVSRDCAHLGYQGWFAALLNWPTFESYRSVANDGSPISLIKSQYYWDLPPIPEAKFFEDVSKLLRRIDHSAIRVFAFQTGGVFQPDPEGLRRAAARHGFALTDYTNTDNGAIWRIERMTTPTG